MANSQQSASRRGDSKPHSSRLQPADLISVGIFAALYIVIISVAGALGVIPVFVPLAAVIIPILGGIPLMYFLTKVKKFGMVLILNILVGLMMLVGGMGYFSLFTCLVSGLGAEFILRAGRYESARNTVLAYAVQSLWVVGNFMPFVFTREAFLEQQAGNYGTDYATQLASFMPPWIILVLTAVAFLAGLLGAFVGKRLYRKHFERAGII